MWDEWLESPTTKYFLKYLVDSANEEAEMLKDTIIAGGIIGDIEQKHISTICATLISISEIDYPEVREFYTRER